jgi:hypothetical protein
MLEDGWFVERSAVDAELTRYAHLPITLGRDVTDIL